MGVDQVSKHDHSSDSEGGDNISPAAVSVASATVGGHDNWRQTDSQSLPISLSNDKEYKIEYTSGSQVSSELSLRINGDADGNGNYHRVNVVGNNQSGEDEFIAASVSNTARIEGAIYIRANDPIGDNRVGFYHRFMLGGPFDRFTTLAIAGGRDNTDGLRELSTLGQIGDFVVYERDTTVL